MSKMLGPSDGQKIWRHFQRFAEYDDLKDLYSRIMPQIQLFEDKILEFSKESVQNQSIILRFDELLASKADKLNIDTLYKHCDKLFARIDDQKKFFDKADKVLKDL